MKVRYECNKDGAGMRYGTAEQLLEKVGERFDLIVLRNGRDAPEELHKAGIWAPARGVHSRPMYFQHALSSEKLAEGEGGYR